MTFQAVSNNIIRARRPATAPHSHSRPHTATNRRVVLSQLGPGGEGGDLPPTPDYLWLRQFLEEHPLRNGNEWLADMMAQDHRGQMLGALGGRRWAVALVPCGQAQVLC